MSPAAPRTLLHHSFLLPLSERKTVKRTVLENKHCCERHGLKFKCGKVVMVRQFMVKWFMVKQFVVKRFMVKEIMVKWFLVNM